MPQRAVCPVLLTMQFTEISFAIFFVTVFTLYWLALRKSVKGQNLLLLSASYLFYGWWDWRFLGLILLTTASTFLTALYSRSRCGRGLTVANIVLNVGILLAFKYFNFFSENLSRLLSAFGWQMDRFTIDVLLPVGISFYTFQAIAYSVDVFKGKVEPCRDPVAFATFIAYFPQLVAGPIERASELLPQIVSPRKWNRGYAASGLRMILFGVMKKLCIADMLAIYVDRLYSGNLADPMVCVAAGILFTLEIYCDFSAYCEIARGTSRLLGIELMANFRFPYFSRNIVEFWQRWHISLMLWFRDYIYIPLGGNRRGRVRTVFNTCAVFLISGLWHGAAWNFIAWGAYWALVYVAGKEIFRIRRNDAPLTLSQIPGMVTTFAFVTFGFYIFRCDGGADMLFGLRNLWAFITFFAFLWLVSMPLCRLLQFLSRRMKMSAMIAVLALCVAAAAAVCIGLPWYLALKVWWLLPTLTALCVEWHSRNDGYPLALVPSCAGVRYTLYWLLLVFVFLSEPTEMAFIYFQF